MTRANICGLLFLTSIALPFLQACAAEPRLSSEKYQLELVAQEPDIVTPVAMSFDAKGRLLVVESNTHQRPEDYEGPESDRIRMFADSDGDGKLDRWTTFAEGFRFAVGVLPRPDGAVYVITRQSIALVKDTDGDGVADERRELVRLESADEYPHNGLEGIALGPDGMLYFGLGENHGMAYTLTGSDGSQAQGQGRRGWHLPRHARRRQARTLRQRILESVQHLFRYRGTPVRCRQRSGRQPALPAIARRAGMATTVSCSSMAARGRIRCSPGTANCRARCR